MTTRADEHTRNDGRGDESGRLVAASLPTLAYQPALDGVRACSVIMVLLFHAGFGWMGGGYIGVSVFFTLSGFLITSLLLSESEKSGTISLGAFFSRRVRRLLPASTLCLLLIAVASMLGEFGSVPRFRAQMIGAILDVYNWVQISGDSSYGDVYAAAAAFVSPLEHYWSLAIEEQFYLLWPFVLFALARWGRTRGRPRRALAAIASMFAASAVAAPLLSAHFGPDFAYWSTPTRFVEILAGATLAALLRSGWRPPHWSARLALPALLVIVWLAVVLPSGSGPAYTGWLAPIAVVSALMITGLQLPSRVRGALSVQPLVTLGRMSYGIYLFHWPVFVLLRQHGWTLTTPAGFALAMAVTMAIATASFLTVERGARSISWPPTRTIVTALAVLTAMTWGALTMPVARGFLEPDNNVLAAAAIEPTGASIAPLVPVTTPPVTDEPVNQAATTTMPGASTPVTSVAPLPDEAPTGADIVLAPDMPAVPSRPVRMLVVGDSTAFYVGQAMAGWSVDNDLYARSSLLWCQGCGFVLDGTITSWDAASFLQRSAEVVHDDLPQQIAELAPDVVVLMTTIDDVMNRAWTDDEGVLTPLDEQYEARMEQSYRDVTESILAAGVAHVVWISPPVPTSSWNTLDLTEPERWDVMRDVQQRIAQTSAVPGQVTVIDLQEWMERTGHDVDPEFRLDGVHLTEASAREVVDTFLGPTLLHVALGD